MENPSEIELAVDVLCENLESDPDYYLTWQANIAMAFYDNFSRHYGWADSAIHEIANNAAKEFLNNLIKIS